MSDLGTFDFDADGFIDMSQFPDDGTDLAGSDLADLREVLLSDTVSEPTVEEWDDMVGGIVGDEGDGPFDLGLTATDSVDDDLATGVVAGDDAAGDDGVVSDDDGDGGLGLGDDDSDGSFGDSGSFDDSFDLDPSLELDPSGSAFDDGGLADNFDSSVTETDSSPTAGSDFEDYF